MMQDFVKTYAGKAATTEDFKAMVEKHMTPAMDLDGNHRMDWFFNEYVYGTALPTYQLDATFDKNANGDVVFAYQADAVRRGRQVPHARSYLSGTSRRSHRDASAARHMNGNSSVEREGDAEGDEDRPEARDGELQLRRAGRELEMRSAQIARFQRELATLPEQAATSSKEDRREIALPCLPCSFRKLFYLVLSPMPAFSVFAECERILLAGKTDFRHGRGAGACDRPPQRRY